VATTIEHREKRIELDERYLNAMLRGYEEVLNGCATRPGQTGNQPR
jgi:hypothetical protein